MYTLDEMAALMRSAYGNKNGFVPPSAVEIENMEIDPMSAKFRHVLMYGLMFGVAITQKMEHITTPNAKRPRKFAHDRTALDRMLSGRIQLTHIVVYGKGDKGSERFDLCPLPAQVGAILALLDLSYKEALAVATGNAFDGPSE